MTERSEVFVEEYHWMMVDCLLILTLYFSVKWSCDFLFQWTFSSLWWNLEFASSQVKMQYLA